MDTDDLSEEAYKAIILTAEEFNHDLTLQFGLLSSYCADEQEYLKKSTSMIIVWESKIKYTINDIFFEKKPNQIEFEDILKDIKQKIKEVLALPIEKRKIIDW